MKDLKILIVEDDDSSATLLEMNLMKICKHIDRVSSGSKAVDKIRNHADIDLILMDIKLQEMDGYEATQKIREFNKGVIILAQTAFALKGDKEKALGAGCNGYLSKPIKRNELIKMIKLFI